MACMNFLQPGNLSELVESLGQMTENSRVLAGGTDLLVNLRSKPANYDVILSLCKVSELTGISREGDKVRIGAMETHGNIASAPLINEFFPALSQACDHVGSKQIRNKGTIGGSLGNASVAGDMLPVLVLFEGEIELLCREGTTRLVPALEFQKGPSRTELTVGEVISAIWLPIQEGRRSCFLKMGGRREVTIAELSLSMSWYGEPGAFRQVRGVLGAVDVRPVVLDEAPGLLEGCEIGEEQADALAQSLSERIRQIRLNRKRRPRLRIREGETLFKERAVKGLVYDVLEMMQKIQ